MLFVAALFAPNAIVRAQSVDLTILSPPAPPPLSPSQATVPAPIDFTPYTGKPITDIAIAMDRGPLPEVEEPVIKSVKVGMTFSPKMARMALDDVLGSGNFGDAHVEIETFGAGVRIRIVAVPRVVVDSMRLDVHGAEVDTDEMVRDAEVQESDELLANDFELRKRRLEVFLARAGYPDAKITITPRETEKRNRILLLVDVQPGKPRKLERRVFYAIDADKREIEPITADYQVKVGDRVQELPIEAADVDLERRLRAAGWHEARVDHDVVLASKLVTLRVRIDAGPRYVAKFDGNEKYDTATLLGALGLATENDFSQPHMLDKLKSFYRNRGYLDVEIALDVRPSENGRTKFLMFHVVEHPRVVVAVRSYPCLHDDEVKQLKNGGPSSVKAIGSEIDSFLEEDLPGADLLVSGDPQVIRRQLDNRISKEPVPVDLNPHTVYSPDSYDRAAEHVQDLYRNEGYLAAIVGPVQAMRRRCGPKSLPGKCIPVDPPPDTADLCTYDAAHLPLPSPSLDPAQTCVPDFAHHIECEDKVTLRIPVKLGPRTMLYDLVFTGATQIEEKRLALASQLTLGDYVSQNALEDARRKIADTYKEEGFFYVDVKYAIDKAPDSTRARVRFDIAEGERVIVRRVLIRGNRLTHEGVIRRRVALFEGQPYRTSDVQKTQERIATLGTFSSVSVALQNPYVPTKDKNVIITVVELTPQYIELRGGLSTGEGIRAGVEYGHRNLFGSAIQFTLRVQASFLPVLEIPELYAAGNPGILENFKKLQDQDGAFGRIAGRVTAGFAFPDLPIVGPLWRASLDFVALRDIERDFRLNKAAAIATLYWQPTSQIRTSLSATVEPNNVLPYAYDPANPKTYCDLVTQGANQFILRVPNGGSVIIGAPRFNVSWDRRDASLNAHRGTFVSAGVEHAVSFATGAATSTGDTVCDTALSAAGHFLKLTQTVAGYIPITQKITLAMQLRLGENVQLETGSTYPDRLFYMGGFDSMRGWAQDTFIPQDTLDAINDPTNQAKPEGDPTKLTAANVPIRGGNLMVNPRVELRIPIGGPFETVIFGDFGNLWRDPEYPFCTMRASCIGKRVVEIPIRVAVGSGIRVQTPVGPLALDYGINLTRQAYEDFGALSFSVGLF